MGTSQFIVLVGIVLASATAQSQTMYKCGNVYQDRPCAGGLGKAIGSTGAAGPAAPASGSSDAECTQRGRDSLKIVWSREGGATLERLLSEASTPEQKRLVQDVYRRPGAASSVQAAVEADCIAEKKRLREEAAAAAAAAVLKGPQAGPAPGAPSAPPASSTYGSGSPKPDASAEARERDEARKRTCAGYNADMERLRAADRAGGTAAMMDARREMRRELDRKMAAARC